MKILYLSNDRRAAEQAALSLRAVVPSIRVAWAASFGEALRWIDDNRDVLALIVEVDSDIPGCEAFVRQVRASLIVPVIVVAVNDAARALVTFKSVADAIIAKAPSFFNDLPHVVSRVLGKTQPAPRAARRPLQFLYVGDAALARECLASPGTIDVIEALPEPHRKLDRLPTDIRSGAPLAVDVLFIEHGYPGVETHAILKDIAARRLQTPVVIVAEWDAGFAALSFKLGAIDYVVKSRASFQAVVFRMGRLLAHAAHLRARASVDEVAAAHDQFAQREAEYTKSIAKAARELQALDDKVATTEAALRQAEQRLEEESRAAAARLTEASTARQILEQRVAEADIALRYAEQRAAEQYAARQQATERQAQVESELTRQTAYVDALEQKLAGGELALQRSEEQRMSEATAADARFMEQQKRYEARLSDVAATQGALQAQLVYVEEKLQHVEQHHASEMSEAAARLAEREAKFDTELTQEVARRQALAQELADAQSAHRQAEQEHMSAIAAAAARLADHQQQAQTRLADALAVADTVEAKLRDAVAALERAEERAAVDRQTAADEALQRRAESEGQLAAEATKRQELAKHLADTESVLRQAEQQHSVQMSDAAARLAEREAKFDTELTQELARRQALAQQLADAQSAHRQAEQEHVAIADALEAKLGDAVAALQRAEEHAAVDRQSAAAEALQRHAEFDGQLAAEVATRQALAKQLADVEAALQQADQEHASEMREAVARLAATEKEADARSAQAAAVIRRLEGTVAETAAALTSVEQQAATERQAAIDEAARRQAEFDTELTQEAARREALAKQLADAQSAHRQAERDHMSAIAAADALQAKLGDAVAALERAEERAAVDRQTAADEAVQRRAEFEAQLAAEVTKRQELAKHLADAETALQQAEQQHASEMREGVARLVATEKEADARATETAAVISALERTLSDTAVTLRRVEQQAAEERQAATEAAARRQAEFEAALAQQVANQHALQNALINAESAHRRLEQQHASEIEAAAARFAEYQKEAQAQLARAAAVERELAETRASAEQAQRRFMDADAAMRQRAREYEARIERAEKEFERARMALEVDLARQRAEYTALQQILDRTQVTAEEALASASRDRAAERVRFEALVAERDSQLRDQAARYQASHEAAEKTVADAEHRLNLTLEAGYRDRQTIARLREQLKAVEGQLDATRRQREVLKTEADRVPQLRKDIEEIHAENRRHFDRMPVNICRCTQDGTISVANQAFANFLGYETPAELQKLDFAASVFESADEMQWIAERCLASRATESVETTWTRKDGSRIIVRVLAVATAPDSIDLTAEDITTLRVLEEKLRISQRMEAVARYASEVAVTCDNLLGHVEQEGLHWLARVDSDAARYHGELLLEEVTRAAKYLRQLAVYGNEEKKAPELVDMNTVLRDLEPVLKRVAGSEIDLVLPKAATPLNLDVEAERVERMLVNVAAYGRERMPLGGRLMFEVAPVVVDRTFVAKYPNVRPGAHVLLTVNEVRGAARPDFSAAVGNQASGAKTIASASKSPGVDLGALQALVSDCGGHLWMMVEPPGDMTLKIHLPRRALDRPDLRTPAKASVRTRWINRPAGVGH